MQAMRGPASELTITIGYDAPLASGDAMLLTRRDKLPVLRKDPLQEFGRERFQISYGNIGGGKLDELRFECPFLSNCTCTSRMPSTSRACRSCRRTSKTSLTKKICPKFAVVSETFRAAGTLSATGFCIASSRGSGARDDRRHFDSSREQT
jgi:hypothetical protein